MQEEHIKLAFVDIETTGTRVHSDRVIEVAAIIVEDGVVKETFATLIDPQTYVSPYIASYTGITPDLLESAPTFGEVKDRLFELLQDATFVAHNVRFDYGFLKNEFKRYGIIFQRPQLCTVKLSRRLFPKEKRHNLSALIERFNLTCANRHRALDDAMATWEFFRLAQSQAEAIAFETVVKQVMGKPALPAHLPADTLKSLPECPGVYIFYDDKNYPLYVGKSKNIRDRVSSHFTNDYTSSKEMNLCQNVRHIEALPTAGELGALLKESELVKNMQPLYNRKLRQLSQVVAVKKHLTPQGYYAATFESCRIIEVAEIEHVIGICKSVKQAKGYLMTLAKEHRLCHKLLNLETGKGACFGSQLSTCDGACTEQELSVKYNVRFTEAFASKSIKPWPFSGPIVIEEGTDEKRETFLVDKWCLLGSIRFDEQFELPSEQSYTFDLDAYTILARYLKDEANSARVKVLQRSLSR